MEKHKKNQPITLQLNRGLHTGTNETVALLQFSKQTEGILDKSNKMTTGSAKILTCLCNNRFRSKTWLFALQHSLWSINMSHCEARKISDDGTAWMPDRSKPLLVAFSTVILSLPLIQERQLSVTSKRMCTEYCLTA